MIEKVHNEDLCTGCGTCMGVCPNEAIKIIKDEHRDIYIPQLDKNLCSECGLCLKVCPGYSVDFKELNLEIFDKEPGDVLIGNYIKCYIGHAIDEKIRYNASSGGLITQLLIFALEKGIIDGAIVTKMHEKNPLETKVFIARSKEELIEASGSKYCPSPVNTILKEIALSKEDKFAFVGLPCHLHGIRKAERIDKKLESKIVLHFGLFCGNTVTSLGTEYFLQKLSVEKKDVKKLDYRGGGWPGEIVVSLINGRKKIFSRKFDEISTSDSIHYESAFHFDFIPPRCLLCCDETSELSDISFGDPWLPELKDEKTGKNLIISRSKMGADLLQKALNEGKIELSEISPTKVLESQGSALIFKKNLSHRLNLLHLLKKHTPYYNSTFLKPSWVDYLYFIFFYTPSYFSSNKHLWALISFYSYIRYFLIKPVFRRLYKLSKIFNSSRD